MFNQIFGFNLGSPFNSRTWLFGGMPFRELMEKIHAGLQEPPDSGRHKWAKLQVYRLYARATSILTVILMVALVGVIPVSKPLPDPPTSGTIDIEPTPPPPELEKTVPPEKPPEPDLCDKTPAENWGVANPAFADAIPETGDPLAKDFPDLKQTPTLEDLGVARINSVIKMKDIPPGKQPPGRDKRIRDKGGTPQGEAAVLKALRWLKKNQQSDGSWAKTKPAMTGLALLCFLAHGEVPGYGEFADCVEAGLRWLVQNQTDDGRFKGSDGHEYSLPIAAYALCEGYGMTTISDLKYAAEKSINLIIRGQHAGGGWNYNLNMENRDDTSYMGWCLQALKAAQVAKLNCPGLDNACKKAMSGFRKNFAGSYELGGFGYTGPEKQHGLTSVGVLCMQMCGAARSDEVMGGLACLNTQPYQSYDLDNPAPGPNALYYWYYTTQAKFHAGAADWNRWNQLFSKELVVKQKVITKDASRYVDDNQKPFDIGYWDQYKGHGANEGPVFATTLCTLQLEVYYRTLGTFDVKKMDPAAAPAESKEPVKTRGISIELIDKPSVILGAL